MGEGLEGRLRDTATRLVEHIERVVPTIRCSDAYPMTAVSALVRCRSLVRSTLNHDRDGLHDLMGADLRMLFEYFVFGLYVLHGGDEEMERLRRHELRKRNALARATGWDLIMAEREPGGDDRLTFENMCKAVGELMTARGSQHGDVLSLGYRVLYRGESYLNTHPSLQGLGLYMHEDENGHAVGLTRPNDVELASSRILQGAALVVHLAHDVFSHVGLDTVGVDRIGVELDGFQELMINPPSEEDGLSGRD